MEQAVIIHIKLKGSSFGNEGERETLEALQNQLDAAIEDAEAGEFDGDEYGGWQCVLYMYGTNADFLFETIAPILRTCPLAEGGYAIKRYGGAGDSNSTQVRITW